MNFLTNWKTSLGGVLTAAIGAASLFGVHLTGSGNVDPNTAIGMIVGGLTLIFAKDQNVTGGTKPQ
jgi:hypothetical protein